MTRNHRFNPAIPETSIDLSVNALLDAIGSDCPPAVAFGDASCPQGTIAIPRLGCCWSFDCGAVKAIERISQGRSNTWLMAWTCKAANLQRVKPPGSDLSNSRADGQGSQQPWWVDDPDGGIFVFPLGMDLSIGFGETALEIPAGTMLGREMFYPKGLKSFVPGNRTYAVVRALTGYALVSQCVAEAEARGLQTPAYLVADVPDRRLVTLGERFGFREIGTFGTMTSVIAPFDLVMARVNEYEGRVARLSQRAQREANRI